MERTKGPVAAPAHPFTLKVAVASLLAAGLMSGASVWAQQTVPADTGNGAVVTVTGVRNAAKSAQTIKQNADQVVDSIVADDIGKFPDKNVAEILGRVTGVQIIRENGEAGNVIIRGLPGVVTLINGREMFTSVGRSLFLADIPTAMLQRLDVYKTQGAEMVEGGTAGVIDVRTNRPFDFKGYQASVNARVENRDKAGSNDPNLSGMVSNRWKTSIGEFGALVGYSYQRGRYLDETAWLGQPLTIDNGVTGADAAGRVMGRGDRKRWATNGAIQWRPTSDIDLFAEVISTRIEHDSESNFFVGQFPTNKGAAITTFPGTNYLESIGLNGANQWALSSTQARRHYSRGTQGAIGGTWDATPQLRLTSELARTISKYRNSNPIVDVVGFPANVFGGVRDRAGYIDYPGTDMTDGKNFFIEKLFDNHSHDEGSSTDWRADAIYELENKGFFREFSTGVRVAQRKAASIHGIEGFVNAPGAYSPNEIKADTVPGFGCVSPATAGNYGMKQFFVPCASYLLDNISDLRQMFSGNANAKPDDPLSYFSDVEKTQAWYGKTKFGFDAGSIPVDGTLGVRIVRTEQDLKGNSLINGVVTPANQKTSDTDVMPSLTLRAKFRQDLQGRFTAGKSIQRPVFADFNPGVTLRPAGNTGQATGTAGNPDLKPIEGTNLDASLEWYFAPTGSVTGTVFFHDFKNYIRRKSAKETYDGVTYDVDRPYNTTEGNLDGFELAYQQFYDWLPGWMSGLGLQANATYMRGGLTEPDGASNTFAGMSKYSYNVVGLYERGDWSARLAYNWRSKFTSEYNYRASEYNLLVDPIKTLDASLSYKVNKNVTLTLDGSNLLDQEYHDYHSFKQLPRDVRRYDRTIGLSLRWRN